MPPINNIRCGEEDIEIVLGLEAQPRIRGLPTTAQCEKIRQIFHFSKFIFRNKTKKKGSTNDDILNQLGLLSNILGSKVTVQVQPNILTPKL